MYHDRNVVLGSISIFQICEKKRDFLDPTKIEYSKTTYFTVLRKTRWQMIGQKTAKNAFLDDFTKCGIFACETEENLINVNRFRT